MPLIMCTKFQINQIMLALFSGVWDKNLTPVAEKVTKMPYSIVLTTFSQIFPVTSIFFKILKTGTKGGIIPKSERNPDVRD